MTSELPPADAIVIGGGLAGLTVASFLGRQGHRVTVFEKAPALGGRAATHVHDGYAFNVGPHALYTGGAAGAILKDLGVRYRSGTPRAVFGLRGGTFYPLPVSPLALVSGGLLGGGGTLELLRTFRTLVQSDPRTLGHTTVQQWLDKTIQHPSVRQLVTALARTLLYSTALDIASADVLVDKLRRSLTHPIQYVDGGWQTLVDGVRQAAAGAGARIATGVRVQSVEQQDGHVTGVRARDGRFVPASAVILATTPEEAVKLVDGSAGASLRREVDGLVPAQLACLDVALRRLPDGRRPVVQDLERPRFATAQSRYARVAPAGGALIHVFKQLDPRHPSDARADEAELEELLDVAQPGWRGLVVRRVFLPHMDGATALPLAGSGGFAGRPGPRVPGLDGLYLAGDWVGPDGYLVDASLASGRAAARLVAAQVDVRGHAHAGLSVAA